jgi:hypothetical protein
VSPPARRPSSRCQALSASGTGDADVVEDVVLGHASPAGLQFPGAGVHHRGPLPGGGWCGCSQDAMTGV